MPFWVSTFWWEEFEGGWTLPGLVARLAGASRAARLSSAGNTIRAASAAPTRWPFRGPAPFSDPAGRSTTAIPPGSRAPAANAGAGVALADRAPRPRAACCQHPFRFTLAPERQRIVQALPPAAPPAPSLAKAAHHRRLAVFAKAPVICGVLLPLHCVPSSASRRQPRQNACGCCFCLASGPQTRLPQFRIQGPRHHRPPPGQRAAGAGQPPATPPCVRPECPARAKSRARFAACRVDGIPMRSGVSMAALPPFSPLSARFFFTPHQRNPERHYG